MDEGLVSKQTRAVSAISRSKVTFRQVTSRKQQMKISEGRLFIYDNRKDTSEFKALVSQIRTRYSESREIVFISRIDEFNYYCLKNKEKDHILLMSQYSYINLSEYFSNYRSIAVFDDGTSKMNYYLTNKVALFSSDKSSIFRFVQMFDRKKG